MLQTLKNRQQAGFTLVELLIVIVVIAILAAIVITTFSGVQARARDTERQTDIKALASQLEVYYTNEGSYPTRAQMISDTTLPTTFLEGLSEDALTDPQAATTEDNSIGTAAPTATNHAYRYNCTAAADTDPCTDFTLTYWSEAKEGGAGTIDVKSLTN